MTRLQRELDAARTAAERNRLGQFATPARLAEEMVRFGAALLAEAEPVRFLDPAIGTGAFYAALRQVLPRERVATAVGFEVDRHYAQPAAQLWAGTGLDYKHADFTQAVAVPRFNFVICNPPYVRHHHLTALDKSRLQQRTEQASGMRVGGRGGLYCHFLGMAHAWMMAGAVAGWLIPSEFMDVNYGAALRKYLATEVTLLQIHRFDPHAVQFTDALVSSAVVWLRKAPPPPQHAVEFSFGGTLLQPEVSRCVSVQALAQETKWTRFPAAAVREKTAAPTVSDFFVIRRGVATGDNHYFILEAAEIVRRGLPEQLFRPILPSPRYVPDDRIDSDARGCPVLDRQLFLLDTDLTETQIEQRFPALFAYLQEGRRRRLQERYLCAHRAPWYSQERRPPAPILCTYLGRRAGTRRQPFRFILNRSQATAANVYLMMYPTGLLASAIEREPGLLERAWVMLNDMAPQALVDAGRVYGGGLHKLEPRELANIPLPGISSLCSAG
jgi:methylase of polypeptide subunit release factors